MICFKQALRRDSGPVLFLVGVCMTMAILFLSLDAGVGWIFILAAGSALMAFGLLGARDGCGYGFESKRWVPGS